MICSVSTGDELDVLMLLVEKYEDWRARRVSEVLNGKRNLTLPMVKRLHAGLTRG